MNIEKGKIQVDYKDKIVPIEKWSKDHWSTLAYVETRVVDHRGLIDNRHMRCNRKLHLKFATQLTVNGAEYPTRLKNNEEALNHDDFSCLEDFGAYGLLTEEYIETAEKKVAFQGWRTIQVKLTTIGMKLCAELRAHKALGGQFAEFKLSAEALSEINNSYEVKLK